MTNTKQSDKQHNTMTKTHAAGWVRFQRALCNIGRDAKRYPYLLNSKRHRNAVHIIGYGTEEELKYEMSLWRLDFPALFEDEDDEDE